MALALGLLHVVLFEGKEDRQFIGERTVGWEAFRQRILDSPPSRAAAITGLPTESIVELGKRLAETRPTGIRIGIGLQRHGGGGMAVRTVTCSSQHRIPRPWSVSCSRRANDLSA